ncbi:MAG: hypothetical protein QOC63_3626 [Mycobacterium sp.]|jgi:hypothetical protein|nr:hypothetical protein [Mycobacterium sp.]
MAAKWITQISPSPRFAEMVAAVLVGGYLVACLALYIGAGDARWDNRIKIFEALAPLVGLAVGWVFGKEVHRQQAADAKHAAEVAKGDADKGHALAGAVDQALRNYHKARGTTDAELPGDATSLLCHLESLADQAEELFSP